VRKWSTGRT